jgi:hypothetical protein
MDMTATALSSLDMGACVGGSSSGMHRRQQMACDRGTRPPPLNCIGKELLSGRTELQQSGHKHLMVISKIVFKGSIFPGLALMSLHHSCSPKIPRAQSWICASLPSHMTAHSGCRLPSHKRKSGAETSHSQLQKKECIMSSCS